MMSMLSTGSEIEISLRYECEIRRAFLTVAWDAREGDIHVDYQFLASTLVDDLKEVVNLVRLLMSLQACE